MQTIELDNHAAQQIQQLEAEREEANQAILARWRQQAASIDSANRRVRARLARAIRDRRLLQLLKLFLVPGLRRLQRPPAMPRMVYMSKEERIWREGQAGEARVAERLAEVLDDRWTLIAGYHNPRGEIDQILVGPGGIHAIEIKYRNAVIHCQGDRWYFDRYDNYGNLVESNRRLKDCGGRSPAQQVNDPARMLQSYLQRPVPDVAIHTHVVLSHDKSVIGQVRDLTVDSIATIDDPDFVARFTSTGEQLQPGQVRKIVNLVRQSHRRARKLPRRQPRRHLQCHAGAAFSARSELPGIIHGTDC